MRLDHFPPVGLLATNQRLPADKVVYDLVVAVSGYPHPFHEWACSWRASAPIPGSYCHIIYSCIPLSPPVGAASLCCQWNKHPRVRTNRQLLWALESTKELGSGMTMYNCTVSTFEWISLDGQSQRASEAFPREMRDIR